MNNAVIKMRVLGLEPKTYDLKGRCIGLLKMVILFQYARFLDFQFIIKDFGYMYISHILYGLDKN